METDNMVKILIVIVVILTGGVGLIGGFILGEYLIENNNTNNTTDNQNSTLNTTNNNTTQTTESNNQQSQFITPAQAISIAQSAVPEDTLFSILTYPTEDYPYYQVSTDYSYGHPDGHVTIDAITGEIVEIMHGLSPGCSWCEPL